MDAIDVLRCTSRVRDVSDFCKFLDLVELALLHHPFVVLPDALDPVEKLAVLVRKSANHLVLTRRCGSIGETAHQLDVLADQESVFCHSTPPFGRTPPRLVV